MGLGTLIALGAIPLYTSLAARFGAEGLVVAGGIAINLNALLTLAWARIRFGGPDLAPLLSTGIRGLAAGGLAALAASQVIGGEPGSGLQDLALGGGVFLVTVGVVGWALGDSALRGALSQGVTRVRSRLPGGRARRGD